MLLLVFPPFTGCGLSPVFNRSEVANDLEGKQNQMMQLEPYAQSQIGSHEGVDRIQLLRLARIGMRRARSRRVSFTIDQRV